MGSLLLPVGPRPMSSWAAHQRRVPRSVEPGTDFYCPIGTPVLAPYDGIIYGYGTSIGPATGRWVGINLDNGMSFRTLHLLRVIRTGGRVKRGEVIGISGASGYGDEDWSWNPATGGAHTHVTLWPSFIKRFGYDSNGNPYTVDFMKYADLSGPAGGGGTPLPTPDPDEKEEDEEMAMKGATYKRKSDSAFVYILFNEVSGFYSEHSGVDGTYNNSIAQKWGTGSWPTITESHATALKANLDRTRTAT